MVAISSATTMLKTASSTEAANTVSPVKTIRAAQMPTYMLMGTMCERGVEMFLVRRQDGNWVLRVSSLSRHVSC